MNDYLINLKKHFNLKDDSSVIVEPSSIDIGTILLLKKNNIRLKSLTYYLFFFYKDELILDQQNNMVFITNGNDLINENYQQFHIWIKTIIKRGVVGNLLNKEKRNSLYRNSIEAYEAISPKIISEGSQATSKAANDEFENMNINCKKLLKFINAKAKEGVLIDSIYLYTYYLCILKNIPKSETKNIIVKSPKEGIKYGEFVKYIYRSGYSDDFIDYLKRKLRSINRIHNPFFDDKQRDYDYQNSYQKSYSEEKNYNRISDEQDLEY